MKLIHTADWHLGHRLGPFDRTVEHEAFLRWLLALLHNESADVLCVSGDVFDRGNPPAEALAQFYAFVAEARRQQPALQILVIGGNHDAPARLDAPAPILDPLGVHVLGALPRRSDGSLDAARACVPLRGPGGSVEAVACLVPFVRAVDTAGFADADAVCSRVLAEAAAGLPAHTALIALAHGEVAGAALTPESERRVVGGGLSPATFAAATYTALGHLHFAQSVGGHDAIRYSGSPIPLSMAERDYVHAVNVVEIAEGALVGIRACAVPRLVDLMRVGDADASVDAVLAALEALDVPERPEALRPLLDVRVRLDGPEPDLRGRVERALGNKPVRLVRVQAARTVGVSEETAPDALVDATPEAVLERLYFAHHQAPLPVHLRRAFAELIDDVEREHVEAGEAA